MSTPNLLLPVCSPLSADADPALVEQASRSLHFTGGGMKFFMFLEFVAIVLAATHAILLLCYERVGQEHGLGMFSFFVAWFTTYAAAASLLYGFVFSVTLCPPLGVSIGFMRPGPAHGSASRLSPTCWGWTVLSIQYLLAAGFATGITLGQAHSEAVSAGILFGTAVGGVLRRRLHHHSPVLWGSGVDMHGHMPWHDAPSHAPLHGLDWYAATGSYFRY